MIVCIVCIIVDATAARHRYHWRWRSCNNRNQISIATYINSRITVKCGVMMICSFICPFAHLMSIISPSTELRLTFGNVLPAFAIWWDSLRSQCWKYCSFRHLALTVHSCDFNENRKFSCNRSGTSLHRLICAPHGPQKMANAKRTTFINFYAPQTLQICKENPWNTLRLTPGVIYTENTGGRQISILEKKKSR